MALPFQQADLHRDGLLFRRHRLRSFREGEDSTGWSDEVPALMGHAFDAGITQTMESELD